MITKRTLIVTLWSIGFCLLTGGLLGVFYYIITTEKNHTIEYAYRAAELRANSNELTSLMSLVSKTADERAKLQSFVLTEETVIDFLALLETLAAEQGLVYKTESIQEKKLSNRFKTLTLNLSAYGTYPGVAHFIALLETLPYQSSISEINLTKDNDDDPADWKVTLVLTVIQRSLP